MTNVDVDDIDAIRTVLAELARLRSAMPRNVLRASSGHVYRIGCAECEAAAAGTEPEAFYDRLCELGDE